MKNETPLIERTYRVSKPSGEVTEVNRFDLNLARCVGLVKYLQCTDGTWMRADKLTIIQ